MKKEPLKFPECVAALHRALLLGCNLEPMRANAGQERAWWELAQEMKPLEDTEEGPFGLDDLVAAMAHLRKQNDQREPKFRKKLVPNSLLADPAAMFDIVCEVRRARRLRERPRARTVQRTTPAGNNVAEEIEPAAESEPVSLTDLMAEETRRLNAQ